jgi:preprotein translocase subunit YajC
MFFLQDAAAAAGTGSLLVSMLPIFLIFVIFYFFIIRPQNKKQKETDKMIAALKKGDKVVTIGGIHGTVAQTKEKTVIIKVDDNTKIEFTRSAISSVILQKEEKADKKDKNAEEKAVEDKTEEK